ncbi:hypothetical protein M422DRAFT_778451, partial [Sphaerobolus stellatus SS14]
MARFPSDDESERSENNDATAEKRRADPRKYEVADLLTLRSNDSGHISPEYDVLSTLIYEQYLTQYYTGDSDAHYSAYNDQIVLEHSTDEASNAHLISQYSSQAATALPQSNNDTQPLDRTASFGALLVPHGTPLPIRPDPSQLQQPYFEQPYVDLNVTRKLDSNQYGSQSAVSDQQLAIIANGAIGTPGRTYLALPTSTSTPSMIAGDTNGML